MQSQRQPQRRLLALDPGGRRTGVAVSDDLGLLAHPRPSISAASTEVLAASVAAAVEREGAEEVVVGLPLSMSGGDSEQTVRARKVAALLRERLSVPVTTWDERLSTVQATRALGPGRRAKGDIDSAAAALILQAVLDSRRGGSS